MSQPKSAYKRQQQAKRTQHRSAKRRAVKAEWKPRTVPKSQRVQRAVSRAPQRGMPKLVQQAVGRMVERARVLQFPGVYRKAAGE